MTQRILIALAAAGLLTTAPQPVGADEAGSLAKPVKPVTGEQVYVQVCASCHMMDGKGGQGAAAIPALASNPKLAAAVYPIVMVTKGRGAMPWFGDTLSTAQMAGVITYIRTHFGNSYPQPVTTADVAKMLGEPSADSH